MEDQIIRMNENTWRIEDGGVRFFLLTGRDIAETLTDLPVSLLNTHADMDHIGSNGQFASFYMHPAEEANFRRSGKPGTIIPVNDGDEMDLGGRKLRIIHLPGHTPGSIAVLDIQHRVLISGDPVQEHGRIFMFGAHRNIHDYIRSLEKLNTMDSFDELWPSHADLPIKPDVIGQLLEGAKKVARGEITGTIGEFHGMKFKVYDLGFTVMLGDA